MPAAMCFSLDTSRDDLAEALHRYLALHPAFQISYGAGASTAAHWDLAALHPLHARFFSVAPPAMPIARYLQRLLTYARCSTEAFIMALVLLDRLSGSERGDEHRDDDGSPRAPVAGTLPPPIPVVDQSIHRLFFAALVVSIKLHDDIFLQNTYYAQVGGTPPHEANVLELGVLTSLNFDRLHIDSDCYAAKLAEVWACMHHGVPQGLAARRPHTLLNLPAVQATIHAAAACGDGGAVTAAAALEGAHRHATHKQHHHARVSPQGVVALGCQQQQQQQRRSSIYPKSYRYHDSEDLVA